MEEKFGEMEIKDDAELSETNATASSGGRRSSGESKKSSGADVPGVTTRNWARKARVQTRAMSANVKPSSALLAAKKKAQQKKKTTFDIELRDHFQTAMDSKNTIRGEVELILDRRMLEHCCIWDSKYPECPERLSSIIDRCEELKLVERCVLIDSQSATKEDVMQLHSENVYDLLLSTHRSDDHQLLEKLSSRYDAVYIHPSTHELSLLAAGSTIKITEDVVKGKAGSGMALVRPPGHHAMNAEPCGYCFYNNVGLAANHALKNLNVSRILIVDWDVHHGQATQQMFYNDPRVVYFSIHRYEHGSFWPNLCQSNFNYIGEGSGKGFNFNIPLNQTKMQDSDYLAIFHQLLLPMAMEYQPQLILVSAGYDAALGCPEGEMEVTPACYAHLTHLLMGVCSKIVVVLEGGYCIPSLAESAALTLRTLLGDPVPQLLYYTPPTESIKETILNCIYVQKPYWKCFNYQPVYSIDDTIPNVSDVNKIKHKVEYKWLGDETRPETFATRDCYPIQSQEFLDAVNKKLSHLKIVTDLSISTNRVCYVYDETMLKHKNIHESHHPERPERISRIHSRLLDWKLLKRMVKLESRTATVEELELAHTSSLIAFLQTLSNCSTSSLFNQQQKYESIYFHNDTYLSAITAVGNVLQVVDSVLLGNSQSGICIVRPPGHHACEDLPSGFCLFNNVALAAKYAMSTHDVKRILILDWDVHHGNGTQSMFLDDPRVLYISLHRYDYGTFFPSSSEGNYTETGGPSAPGKNVNIPWNKRGMGDREYIAAFIQVVLPIAYEFNPELVFISAGFDACVGDPLGGCKVTPECYGRMTHWLSGLAKGKVILCLEGGYNVTSISYSMAMCTKALLGDPLVSHYEPAAAPQAIAIESINDVIDVHKKFWKNLAFQIALPKENVLSPPLPSRGLETGESIKATRCSKEELTQSSPDDNSDRDVFYDCSDSDTINKNSFTESSPEKSDQSTKQTDTSTEDIDNNQPSTSSSSKIVQQTLTLSTFLSDHAEALLNEDMYAVIPLKDCPHVECVKDANKISSAHFKPDLKCNECEFKEEIWICLHCELPACGRYMNGHMLNHFESTNHPMVLSLADLSVWCSSCEAYIDNRFLYPYKNMAHIEKFGEIMPWTYD